MALISKTDIVTVKEQPALSKSIYCELTITNSTGGGIRLGKMYFVTDLNKMVIQYPNWLNSEQNVKEQLISLGYSFT